MRAQRDRYVERPQPQSELKRTYNPSWIS
jgi:hypothetical protein